MSEQPQRPRYQTTDDMEAGYAGQQPPGGPPPKPRKKRKRIFMWFFLAVQALFLIWIITGLATVHTAPTTSDVANLCGNGQWQGLFTSYKDCVVHGANGLNDAGTIGKGIGLALVIGLWVAVDIILGIGRLVVVFSRRSHS